MRKLLLLTALSFCLPGQSSSYAQNTFAPVGAEWWYHGNCYDYDNWCEQGVQFPDWLDHMQSVKDTAILNKSARMLAATRYKGYVSSTSISQQDTFYVYNNDDTVFVYDKVIADFTPLYIFNVAVGDTVCLRKPNNTDLNLSPNFCIVIDSIKLETYDNEQLTSYYNHNINGTSGVSLNWGISKWLGVDLGNDKFLNAGKYTTKIGGNWLESGSFFPEKSLGNPDYYKVIGFPTGTFHCYSDGAVNIKMTPGACDIITGIAALETSKYQISLFPNPSHGTFKLTVQRPLKEALKVQVTDFSGRMLLTTALAAGKTSQELNLQHLGAGTYLLLLQAGTERYYHKLVIRR